QARRVLRLAALLAQRAHAADERELRRRRPTRRISRAALLGRRHRLLARRPIRGRVGPVPEPSLRPPRRSRAAAPERDGPEGERLRLGLCAPAGALARPCGWPARRRLGPRDRLPRPRQLGSLHAEPSASVVQRSPNPGDRLARPAHALHARDAGGADGLHGNPRPRLARLDLLPVVDPVPALAARLRPQPGRRAPSRAGGPGPALAGLLPERA